MYNISSKSNLVYKRVMTNFLMTEVHYLTRVLQKEGENTQG